MVAPPPTAETLAFEMNLRLQELRKRNAKLSMRIDDMLKSSRKSYLIYLLLWLAILFVSIANTIAVMVFQGRIAKVISVVFIFSYLMGFVAVMVMGMTQQETLT